MESKPEEEGLRCTCNWLYDVVANPEMPITFNTEMNEFELNGGKSIWMIYYCPF